jgi:hypothetical protein
VAWSDTQDCSDRLATFSAHAAALLPNFTLYPGDLVDHWDVAAMDSWVAQLNGGSSPGNGMWDITFAVRGGHDAIDDATGYADYLVAQSHPMSLVAANVGATHYASRAHPSDTANLDYSFDYGNSHFVGIDAVDGEGSDTVTEDQLSWLDQDLTAAEGRPLTHAFLFFHTPIYTVGKHCCAELTGFTPVLSSHSLVTATFHGHEHAFAHVLLDGSRLPGLTHEVHQFVDGSAGCDAVDCEVGRADQCLAEEGFLLVQVNDRSVSVGWNNIDGPVPTTTVAWTKP